MMISQQQQTLDHKMSITLFSIPVRNYITSIQNRSIVKTQTHKGNITTWVYKCKAEFLTAYNYTFAVHLASLMNREFDIMAQVVPLNTKQATQQNSKSPSSLQQPQQTISSYQMFYRFDKYEPSSLDIIKEKNSPDYSKSQKQSQPMVELLHRYIPKESICQVLASYKSLLTPQKFIELQKKLIQSDYSLQLIQQTFSDKETITSLRSPTSRLNKQSQKFQFYVQHTNRQDQLDILIFEINILLALHLKQYHLYHDFKQCGTKFVQMMKATMSNYPWFNQYGS